MNDETDCKHAEEVFRAIVVQDASGAMSVVPAFIGAVVTVAGKAWSVAVIDDGVVLQRLEVTDDRQVQLAAFERQKSEHKRVIGELKRDILALKTDLLKVVAAAEVHAERPEPDLLNVFGALASQSARLQEQEQFLANLKMGPVTTTCVQHTQLLELNLEVECDGTRVMLCASLGRSAVPLVKKVVTDIAVPVFNVKHVTTRDPVRCLAIVGRDTIWTIEGGSVIQRHANGGLTSGHLMESPSSLCADNDHVVVANLGASVYCHKLNEVKCLCYGEKVSAVALNRHFVFVAIGPSVIEIMHRDSWDYKNSIKLPQGNVVSHLAVSGSTLFVLCFTAPHNSTLCVYRTNPVTLCKTLRLPCGTLRGLTATSSRVMTLGSMEICVYDHSLVHCSTIVCPDVEAFAATDARLFIARRSGDVTTIVSQPFAS
jgi:hypothetical protein